MTFGRGTAIAERIRRLGAAVGPSLFIDVIAKLNVNDESCSNHFVQYGALEGPTGDQFGPQRIVDTLRERRDAAVGILNEIPGVRCFRPESTFYLFPNVTGLMESKGSAPTTNSAARHWSRRASASAPVCISAANWPARPSATCVSPTPGSTRR